MIPEPKPEREGFRLTQDAEDLYELYVTRCDSQGCTCWQVAPCITCTHDGHPEALLRDGAMWEPDLNRGPDFSKITASLS